MAPRRPASEAPELLLSKTRSWARGKVDKTVLTIAEPVRIRDRAYLDSAQHRPCERCGSRLGVVGCHLNAEGHGGTALKVGDDQVLFMCARCHWEMDTDPRGVPVWLLEELIRPALARRYQNHLAGTTASWTFGAPLNGRNTVA